MPGRDVFSSRSSIGHSSVSGRMSAFAQSHRLTACHTRSELRRIVIIGSGPSAIYALKELICSRVRLSITIVESKSMAGVGNPYDPATTDAAMLANIASIELPPVVDRLSDWLLSQDDQMLSSVGLQRDAVDERAFVPRIAIGAYYAGQLATLVAAASRNGHAIEILVESRVVDVVEGVESVSVTLTNADGEQATLQTDLVVIAIGHGDGDDAANAGRIATPAYPLQTRARRRPADRRPWNLVERDRRRRWRGAPVR